MIFQPILAKSGVQFTLTVTATDGAAISATNGNKTVNGVASGGQCVLTLPEAGTWEVTGALGDQTSTTTVSISDSYSAELDFIGSLNDTSWEKISGLSTAGKAANYWSVGDRKQVTLNGTVGSLALSNYSTYAFIIGFDHNASLEGAGRIHFQLAKTALSGGADVCFIDSSYGAVGTTVAFRMNTSNTTAGGWESSFMRNYICGGDLAADDLYGTIVSVIPAALRSVLKSVTKYTDNTGGGGSGLGRVTATTDYFFLLSEFEVSGSVNQANTYEANYQAQYAYYAAGNSKVKYRHTATTTVADWWLRSPQAAYSNLFAFVYSDSTVTVYGPHVSRGFAPAFCV